MKLELLTSHLFLLSVSVPRNRQTCQSSTNKLPHIQELNAPLGAAVTSMGSWFHMDLSFDADSSVGKEFTWYAGDHFLISGSGRSPGEGRGYPLQYSWASLVSQLVKNPPETWETWVLSLGWEDHLEKGKATHSSVLAWRILWTVIVQGVAKSQPRLSDLHFCPTTCSMIWSGGTYPYINSHTSHHLQLNREAFEAPIH